MVNLTPNPSFSLTIRFQLPNRAGMLASVTQAIALAGGHLGHIDLIEQTRQFSLRDVTVDAASTEHAETIVRAVKDLPDIKVMNVYDRTFNLHRGGKIRVESKISLKNQGDLAMAYTPGVGRICTAIAQDPEQVYSLTIKQNMIAIVTDGSAVLGLGNLGPAAALPVMEGKAMLFKEFAGIDAFTICLATQDTDAIVETGKNIAPVFGGINLEDISAPRCFEIENRLRRELDIPVFHDDQHGPAIVPLAGLKNAVAVVGKRIEDLRVVVTGVGAAGVAVTKMLLAAGVADVVGCDRAGIVHSGRSGLSAVKAGYAELTNPRGLTGAADEALAGADVFIGLSQPGAVSAEGIRSMADGAIVFAMANPTPEVLPEEIEDCVAVVGTGRSDYPNQINNVLAFPGVFRGALDVRATAITKNMQLAAAAALAAVVPPDHLEADYVLPSAFDRDVAPAIAAAV